jgi:hypothetical protein
MTFTFIKSRRGRPAQAKQRVLDILLFFPVGIRRSDLLNRSVLSKRALAVALNDLVRQGLVRRTVGGYAELPSREYVGPVALGDVLSQVRGDIQAEDLMRKQPPGRKIPQRVLRKAIGRLLPRTPFYSLSPQAKEIQVPPGAKLVRVDREPLLTPSLATAPTKYTLGITERQGEDIVRVHAKLFGEELVRKVGFVLGFDGVNFDARGRPHLVIAYHPSVLWTRPGYRFSDRPSLNHQV